MRSLQLSLLATILLLSAPLALARTTVVSNAQQNCPGANAEAEAGDIALDAALMPEEAPRKSESTSGKSSGKPGGTPFGKSNKSRWRSLLPGAMR